MWRRNGIAAVLSLRANAGMADPARLMMEASHAHFAFLFLLPDHLHTLPPRTTSSPPDALYTLPAPKKQLHPFEEGDE
jgi:hypothetical protein